MNPHATPKPPEPLPGYRAILLAVDASDHANQAIGEALRLAKMWHSRFSALHVYAAKLHDRRFRQMEGGLPEQYREEQALERQREVHDDLISRGLGIISDAYLDQVEQQAKEQQIPLNRLSPEGKNYREIVREANSGDHDLLVIGALGLGAIDGSRLGSVCQRTVRRSRIDTLIIKEPGRSLAEGPIVVAVDGSAKSYGGLLTALALARQWRVPLRAVAAFDPYYHYVAFNRIAGVLSDEAGKVFRFQEQEQLHEEIIDSGLAKIYQGHLTVCQRIAGEQGMEIETRLLDGKPHDAIGRYLRETRPALLVMGMTGIHADAALDIGSNSEALLHNADCAVLLSQRTYEPRIDHIASTSISWTKEAEQRMQRVPSFVHNMARLAILRYAQEQGHSVITADIVAEATARLMPGRPAEAMREIVEAHDRETVTRPVEEAAEPMRWSSAADRLLHSLKDHALRNNLSLRAEKKARAAGAEMVTEEHIRPFLDHAATPQIHWQAAALARLTQIPAGFMRDRTRERIENLARKEGHDEITLALVEQGLASAREAMGASPSATGGCPFPGKHSR